MSILFIVERSELQLDFSFLRRWGFQVNRFLNYVERLLLDLDICPAEVFAQNSYPQAIQPDGEKRKDDQGGGEPNSDRTE